MRSLPGNAPNGWAPPRPLHLVQRSDFLQKRKKHGHLGRIWSQFLLLPGLLFAFQSLKAQPFCTNPSTPYSVVNLSADPNGQQMLTLEGIGKCCSSQPNNYNCHEVTFLLNGNSDGFVLQQLSPPNQCAINVFNISAGICPDLGTQPGAPTICDPFCGLEGRTSVTYLFCKTGNFNPIDVMVVSQGNPVWQHCNSRTNVKWCWRLLV